MLETTRAPAPPRIPPLIKRNTALVALSQSFSGAGMPLAYGFGPLMVVAVTGSSGLAGLAVGLIGLSRFLVSYPIGKVTDAYGRKPGILLGLVIALIGALTVAGSIGFNSFFMLTAGLLIFGMGMAAAHQLRVAVTDMFPVSRRAEALGYVALGSIAGLGVSPILVSAAERLAPGFDQHPLVLPWLMLPVLIIAGMGLVTLIRPDPKVIGENLGQYFPGAVSTSKRTVMSAGGFSALAMLRHKPIFLAVTANCAAQGNMTIVMVLTSLVLHHHGHSLTAIALSHAFHTLGMFGFTIPLGRLCDRIGRERLMYPGVAVALLGAVMVTFTGAFWSVTLGTFLVGIGWASANVAATALIADCTETSERGRAIGVNDSAAGGMTVFTAFVTGPLVEWSGLPAAGLVAVVFAAVPLALFALHRMRS